MWNYSFCEWIDLGVEINEDWYSVGNIEYDALDDLRGDFLQLFEKDDVLINGWDKMVQEPNEHDEEDFTDER
jgi:regulator of RNase E activity RraB